MYWQLFLLAVSLTSEIFHEFLNGKFCVSRRMGVSLQNFPKIREKYRVRSMLVKITANTCYNNLYDYFSRR